MFVPQSPPTTSGVVIISGSNNFDPPTSDWGVVRGLVVDFVEDSPIPQTDIPILLNEPLKGWTTLSGILITDFTEVILEVAGGFIPNFDDDVSIQTTTVTTSGIVVLDFFPGAGIGEIPYVPPVVINERLFPIFQGTDFTRTFPEENRRIYPVLPQFSTLTPGD